jgi:hypothetical protein
MLQKREQAPRCTKQRLVGGYGAKMIMHGEVERTGEQMLPAPLPRVAGREASPTNAHPINEHHHGML